jgi:hypothetical protein
MDSAKMQAFIRNTYYTDRHPSEVVIPNYAKNTKDEKYYFYRPHGVNSDKEQLEFFYHAKYDMYFRVFNGITDTLEVWDSMYDDSFA